jgi:hypothetical protein
MEWPYDRRIEPTHAWGVIAVGTAAIIGIPAVLATLHATDSHFGWWWPTDWMIVPVAILVIGLILLAVPLRRSVPPSPGDATATLDQTDGAAPQPPLSALVVKIKDDRWENWNYVALIVGLKVEITNTTDRAILIAAYAFTYDSCGNPPWDFQASGEESVALRREVYARQTGRRYGPSLLIHSEVPPHESVSGWFVQAVTRRPMGGTPRCTVIVKDDIGNQYRATIPQQDPQIHGS